MLQHYQVVTLLPVRREPYRCYFALRPLAPAASHTLCSCDIELRLQIPLFLTANALVADGLASTTAPNVRRSPSIPIRADAVLNTAALNSAMNRNVDRASAKADLVLIVANPRAGAGSSAAAIRRLVTAIHGHRLQAQVITDLAELSEIAASAQAEGRLRAVVAGGGDGTLAEVVNRTTPDTPLAVFPLGTANLLANYLGLQPRANEFAAMLATGAAVRMDAGRVTWLDFQRPDSGGAGEGGANDAARSVQNAARGAKSRIFLIVAGVGFDAAVVERLHRERTGHIRSWSYAKPILESLRTYAYPALRYECAVSSAESISLADTVSLAANCGAVGSPASDGQTKLLPVDSYVARWLFVHNLPRYACGLNFARMRPELTACSTFARSSEDRSGTD